MATKPNNSNHYKSIQDVLNEPIKTNKVRIVVDNTKKLSNEANGLKTLISKTEIEPPRTKFDLGSNLLDEKKSTANHNLSKTSTSNLRLVDAISNTSLRKLMMRPSIKPFAQKKRLIFTSSSETEGEECLFHDSADFSVHPSYKILNTRYDLHCLQRYRKVKDMYEKTFQNQVRNLIENKPTALSQYNLMRLLQYTTLWPPLHSRREIAIFKREFFQLSPKEKRRLNTLMTTKFTYDC